MLPTLISAVSGFSFWLYRLLEGGILGVALPLALFFFVLQNCFSLLRGAKSRERTVGPVMGVVMIFGVLTISTFRYAWHDSAAFMLFFASIALLGADARARRAGEPVLSAGMQSADCASIEYQLSVQVKQKKVKAPLPEEAEKPEKQTSIELPLDDPEAVAIVEALMQEQKGQAASKVVLDVVATDAQEPQGETAEPAEPIEAAESVQEVQTLEIKETEGEVADESEEK